MSLSLSLGRFVCGTSLCRVQETGEAKTNEGGGKPVFYVQSWTFSVGKNFDLKLLGVF